MASREENYRNWYTANNYDRLSVFLPKGSRERIKAEAQLRGVSINEFIKNLIPKSLIAEREFVRRKDGTK